MTTNPITHTDEAALLDDHAVDLFAKAMKAKLRVKREQGFGGWDNIGKCSGEALAERLVAAVTKGDPVDVANFAMMLFCRHEHHDSLKTAYAAVLPAQQPEAAADGWKQFRYVLATLISWHRQGASLFPQTAEDHRDDIAAIRHVLTDVEFYEHRQACPTCPPLPSVPVQDENPTIPQPRPGHIA